MITRRKFKTVMRKVRRQRQIKEPEKEEIKEEILAEPEEVEALPKLEEEFEKNVDLLYRLGGSDSVMTRIADTFRLHEEMIDIRSAIVIAHVMETRNRLDELEKVLGVEREPESV